MDALANPFWTSLMTVHRALAIEHDGVLRFPADVAPFVAIAEARPITGETLEALVVEARVRESVFMVGPRPVLPGGWKLTELGVIVQMLCERPIELPIELRDGPQVELLGEDDRGAVLELAALVYPHYFRPRTTVLGRYHGMRGDGRLDAMIGERMALPGLREISAVCTHPACVGRGLARRLLAFASNDLLARGETPFLHVSPTNGRAVRLYEQNGYRRVRDVPFWQISAAPA